MASRFFSQLFRPFLFLQKKPVPRAIPQKTEIFESMLESMGDGIVVVDADENFVVFNGAAERIVGIGATQTRADGWSQTYGLFMPDRQTRLEKNDLPLYRALRGENIDEMEIFVRNAEVPDGVYISVNSRPMRDSKGDINGALAVFRDVTERKRLEQQLIQAQKMEAIGSLAGGIAHDFNNMLASILGNVDIQKFHSQDAQIVREAADAIERACQRALRLTRQLLDFSRHSDERSLPVDLHGCIEEICELMSRTLAGNIKLKKNLQAGPALIQGDPDKLQQVFLNLLVNARDALPENGGEINFATSERTLEGVPHIHVRVSDNGCGIPLEIQSRIFDPFFTTKPRGKGTGMGLAMVYSTVKDHQGKIEVQSVPGQSTEFHLYFPVLGGDAVLPSPSHTEDRRIHRGRGHILLVEDEELVRQAAEKLLKELGYEVTMASDGREALNYYEKHHAAIDLVFMDLAMPNLGGRESAEKMRQINPSVRIVLTSGNSLAPNMFEEARASSQEFVQKPYEVETLSAALAALLQK